MCIPLFAHAAFSVVQFLDLMESRIKIQIEIVAEGVPAGALGTFQYFSTILNRHAQQLKDSTRALCRLAERSNQVLNGLKAKTPTPKGIVPPGIGIGPRQRSSENATVRNFVYGGREGSFTAEGLLEDYEQLHLRCIDLSNMCTQGITLAMNKATIEESRKAVEQSERLKRLTLLATLFIPISFSSSLFGMNVDLLGQSTVNFGCFFVVCLPITLFAYILYLWDFQVLKRCWARFWKGCHGARRDMTPGKSEKDPSHIV
ncbi:hypothetical protein WAI453_008317 [Rhynchosporium graminicola]